MLATLEKNQNVLPGVGSSGVRVPFDKPASRSTEKVLLVGVGFGDPSRRALRRAAALARARGCTLRLVHASSEAPPEPSLPGPDAEPSEDLPDSMRHAQTAVQAWAALLAGIIVPTAQIRVVSGSSQEALLREAARPEVDLVVLGRSERSELDPQSTLAHRLLRACPRPMLVVGEPGTRPVIVAATDCGEERLPVLRVAASMVPALGEKVIAMHNVDLEATRLAKKLGVSLAPRLAAMLGTQVQDWLEESAGKSEFLITQHPESAEAVICAARDQAADLIAVGVRGKGTERKGTAELLLDKCHRSLLFIPLGR